MKETLSKEVNMGKMEKIVVAVKASKEIPKTALVWALTHVVQPGHCITLLVVSPAQSSGRKLWGFPRFSGDCASIPKKSNLGTSAEQKDDITDTCSQMILQLHDVYDPNKVNMKIKVVSGTQCGIVAAEAKKFNASWVILDKKLKNEQKSCMEELQCNVVIMKKSQPKVLRLNLVGSPKKDSKAKSPLLSEAEKSSKKHEIKKVNHKSSVVSAQKQVSTPTSSPEVFTTTEPGTSSVSSSDPGTSPFSVPATEVSEKKESFTRKDDEDLTESSSDSERENLSSTSSSLRFQPWVADMITSSCRSSQAYTTLSKGFLGKFSKLGHGSDTEYSGSLREAISLSRNAPSGPPPLCSICLHKAPIVGKPPRWFTFSELELATGGFSKANFLAEGGFGSVHRGVLPDGQAVAVKQHKLASSQGDQEFCSEVEVLSCAQHRNVVMLIGFCIEDGRRLLVYEYICNKSLDFHLYGRHQVPLEWSARQKIAVGAARGLRYLHEECRVGCIVHRDVRPNNILVTHDFEPMVGDFGLARWQPDGETGESTRVIGTFGYLAPEYAESGQITEKADVYSFGVVLVELVSGRKAVDLNRPRGQQCLTEWARPLLEEDAIDELIDPRLGNCYSEDEVHCMLQAASLCIKRDPHLRPRMSQVLRILEGDFIMESSYVSSPRCEVSNRSDRSWSDQPQYNSSPLSKPLERFSGKHSMDSSMPSCWKTERT
uniref:inactive protein kinase SELMODRAFT_444075-like n=1 Tax=Erigeron canadensis TaxID=72917 RepID=UPI001CB8FC26|nr:inactive protein kinase SELMODRAFT_444075-like [Erigeron canadensis]